MVCRIDRQRPRQRTVAKAAGGGKGGKSGAETACLAWICRSETGGYGVRQKGKGIEGEMDPENVGGSFSPKYTITFTEGLLCGSSRDK